MSERAWPQWVAVVLTSCLLTGCPPNPTVSESECFIEQGGGTALPCAQTDPEPNNTIPLAASMPGTSCDAVSVTGTLAGSDLDAFHGHGKLCDGQRPQLMLDTPGVTACLFVQCSTGSTGISGCDDKSLVVHHPSGLYGCCRSRPGAVVLGTTCGGSNHNVDAFVTVQGQPEQCLTYSARYHL